MPPPADAEPSTLPAFPEKYLRVEADHTGAAALDPRERGDQDEAPS
jgi:hypothetical protein